MNLANLVTFALAAFGSCAVRGSNFAVLSLAALTSIGDSGARHLREVCVSLQNMPRLQLLGVLDMRRLKYVRQYGRTQSWEKIIAGYNLILANERIFPDPILITSQVDWNEHERIDSQLAEIATRQVIEQVQSISGDQPQYRFLARVLSVINPTVLFRMLLSLPQNTESWASNLEREIIQQEFGTQHIVMAWGRMPGYERILLAVKHGRRLIKPYFSTSEAICALMEHVHLDPSDAIEEWEPIAGDICRSILTDHSPKAIHICKMRIKSYTASQLVLLAFNLSRFDSPSLLFLGRNVFDLTQYLSDESFEPTEVHSSIDDALSPEAAVTINVPRPSIIIDPARVLKALGQHYFEEKGVVGVGLEAFFDSATLSTLMFTQLQRILRDPAIYEQVKGAFTIDWGVFRDRLILIGALKEIPLQARLKIALTSMNISWGCEGLIAAYNTHNYEEKQISRLFEYLERLREAHLNSVFLQPIIFNPLDFVTMLEERGLEETRAHFMDTLLRAIEGRPSNDDKLLPVDECIKDPSPASGVRSILTILSRDPRRLNKTLVNLYVTLQRPFDPNDPSDRNIIESSLLCQRHVKELLKLDAGLPECYDVDFDESTLTLHEFQRQCHLATQTSLMATAYQ